MTMLYTQPDTLSYFNAAPHLKLINVGHMPIPQMAVNCQKYLDGCDTPAPEGEAVRFYTLNHLAMIVRNKFTPHEVLPDWALQVMRKYDACLQAQGRRMFTYLALITARESRHACNLAKVGPALVAKYGHALVKQMVATKNCSPMECAKYFMDKPPDITLSSYYNGLVEVFVTGGFSSSYGGQPWSDIAKVLASFIDGKTSMEMMLDTAFTLAHNGGPIFNKGMCYGSYTAEIYKILDVQRSGQMPEYVRTQTPCKNVPLLDTVTMVAALFPEAFGTEIDWYKVEEWRVKDKNEDKGYIKYQSEINSMKKNATPAPAAPKKPPAPPAPPKPVYIDGNKVIGELKIMQGQSVAVVERATT